MILEYSLTNKLPGEKKATDNAIHFKKSEGYLRIKQILT